LSIMVINIKIFYPIVLVIVTANKAKFLLLLNYIELTPLYGYNLIIRACNHA